MGVSLVVVSPSLSWFHISLSTLLYLRISFLSVSLSLYIYIYIYISLYLKIYPRLFLLISWQPSVRFRNNHIGEREFLRSSLWMKIKTANKINTLRPLTVEPLISPLSTPFPTHPTPLLNIYSYLRLFLGCSQQA